MEWFPEEDEEDLLYSPALLARRASESWIIEKPVPEVTAIQLQWLHNHTQCFASTEFYKLI